ncbi:MAG: exosome complex component RRP4 [Patescibacteria group bacterium]|jgi:exosome complex component RRP4
MANQDRKVVIPGETICSGNEFIPSDGVYRDKEDIVAKRFGMVNISDKYVKVIAVSGPYYPRRGNTVIGTIQEATMRGWTVDIGLNNNAFLPVTEVPRFIQKNEMKDFLDHGDTVIAKIWDVGGRGMDLSIKQRGYGQVHEGMILNVNPNKVPRVIGKEGSMVSLIRNATGANITVGQNGKVWLKADTIDLEVKTKEIIDFVVANSTMQGLTLKTEEYIKGMGIEITPKVNESAENDKELEVIENPNNNEENMEGDKE